MEKNMGKQKVVNMKPQSITPQQVLYSLTPALSVEGRARGSIGVAPIGYYRGDARFWDLDLAVVQPLIWAEKQWTLDRLDSRTALGSVTVPIGTAVATVIVGATPILVPAGEVWYVTAWAAAPHVNAGFINADIEMNFLVSCYPKTALGTDKPHYGPEDVPAALGAAAVAAGTYTPEPQLQAGDDLGVPLRLVGGDTVTPTATVRTAPTAGAIAIIDIYLYGRKAKLLVL